MFVFSCDSEKTENATTKGKTKDVDTTQDPSTTPEPEPKTKIPPEQKTKTQTKEVNKPADRAALKNLITDAVKKDGNDVKLNYIDTSDITDMSDLFKDMADFNGDISKWDISKVTVSTFMFHDARKIEEKHKPTT